MRRVLLLILTALAVAVVAAYLAWFPSAREPGYRSVLVWGEEGSEPGQFREPIGIVLLDDEIYVSDAGNNRIQVFDPDGRFLRAFGTEGEGRGRLARPMHIYARDGKLFVAEYLNDRIQVFSPEGESLSVIGSSGSGPAEFDAPGGIAVDAEGRLYVADFYNQRLQILSSEGDFVRQLGVTGKKGIRAGRFNYPTDVDLLSSGEVVVADAYNDRIQIFSPEGELLRKWGGPFALNIPGVFNSWFQTATGLAVGPNGNIFVADFYNHRIQKFTSEGKFLVASGEQGHGPGQLERPTDVAVDANGNVYVVDFGNNRIQKFEPIPKPARESALEGQTSAGRDPSSRAARQGSTPHDATKEHRQWQAVTES